jgi:branched-chain amino acid:cation transporter, LIVCS family
MTKQKSSKTLAAGLAVFSMFFGSGNLVFPLLLGKSVQSETGIAIFGLLLTAVLMPLMGIVTMVIYRGDYQRFFGWLGKWPYLFICTSIIAIIGPFGVLPRCLTIAHAGAAMCFPHLPLLPFSVGACLLIFLASMKKGRLVDILGYYLTPCLLFSLIVIVVKGLFSMPTSAPSELTSFQALKLGFLEGYNTMDLLAAFFFSKTVLLYFETPEGIDLKRTIKAGGIGMGLLALTYVTFAFLGASFGPLLESVPPEQLLMQIAREVLGSFGGIMASVAISLACLTTAIALAEVTTNFLVHDLTNKKLNETWAMGIVLLISIGVSTFEFSGIAAFLVPILTFSYPLLIGVTVINLFCSLIAFDIIRNERIKSFLERYFPSQVNLNRDE